MHFEKLLAGAALGVYALSACATANSADAEEHSQRKVTTPFTVKIIGFNDYHGNLESPGTFGQNTSIPAASRPAVGGAEYVAAYVNNLKAQNPLNVVVGGGDLISASPLISALFHDEPAVETLNRIGLEFSSVGNHEFDHGSAELLRLQNGGCKKLEDGVTDAPNTCQGDLVGTPVPFEGAKFKWLSANVINTATGEPLLPAYGIKKFHGVKVAFIGMTLKATPTIVTPAGVAGLQFNDEADTVNALIPSLRKQGVESIVVLVHQGGFQSAGFSDINGCDGNLAGSDIANVIGRLDDAVDLVISAHTHAAYNCSANTVDVKNVGGAITSTARSTGLPNKTGRLIPVTSASAFGRVLSDIDVTINPATRDITAVSATNRLVNRSSASITPNAEVADIVSGYKSLVSPIANQVIGSITASLPNSATDNACNMPAGDLIADSQLEATAAAEFGGAQIAFMNRGGVRSPGFNYATSVAGEGDGNITYGEAFTVQPFGNSLVTMTLTAQNIKDVLEQQFAGCRGQGAATTRIMIPSKGFSYTWDGSKACNSRIGNVTLTVNGATDTLVDAGGTVLNPAQTYRVTVNNFMATGGDGYTTFLQGTALLGGAQDIDALTAYMANFKAPNAPYDSADPAFGPKPRMARVNAPSGSTTCPSGANVNP